MKVNDKPIILRDKQACQLIEKRAAKEIRPFSHALAITIYESLGEKSKANRSRTFIAGCNKDYRTIILRDKQACRLVKKRAKKKKQSYSDILTSMVFDVLGNKNEN